MRLGTVIAQLPGPVATPAECTAIRGHRAGMLMPRGNPGSAGPESLNSCRQLPVLGGAVAELPAPVVSPAGQVPVPGDDAGVVGTRGEGTGSA